MVASAFLTLLLFSCEKEKADPTEEVVLAPPSLRRLTAAQYALSVRDLLGPVELPHALEPDTEDHGLLSVGAAVTSVSSLGVQRYEEAAYLLAEQVVASDSLRAAILPCAPVSADDAVCAETFVRSFGLRVWRRPLTEEEVASVRDLVTGIGGEAGDFNIGLKFGLAAFLQSPAFLYRKEQGVETGAIRKLDDWEIATRLSYFCWGTTPDALLLEAAGAGRLSTPEGLRAEAVRLLDDERAQSGTGALFDEFLRLYQLETINRSPLVYTHASPTLGPSAHQETLRTIGQIYATDADMHTLLTTTTTFVNPELAALYRIAAPDLHDFAEVQLDPSDRRHGLLGQASILMLYAHTTSTSPTLRGKFVREALLCQTVAPPPAGVAPIIPEPDENAHTMRDRLSVHLTDPACASCHTFMDPIGFGLEQFDGVGRWRTTENGAAINASGSLDGDPFDDGWDLGSAVARHEKFDHCMATHLYSYAMGHAVESGEKPLVDALADQFGQAGSWRDLMLTLIERPQFVQSGSMP